MEGLIVQRGANLSPGWMMADATLSMMPSLSPSGGESVLGT